MSSTFLPSTALQQRKKVSNVTREDFELGRVDEIIQAMLDASWNNLSENCEPCLTNLTGLAAPEIGIFKKIILVDLTPDINEPPTFLVMINPRIYQHSEETLVSKEECFSFPEFMFKMTARYKWVVVKGLNQYNQPIKLKLHGRSSQIVQHNIEHLEGSYLPDPLQVSK